MLNLNYLYSNLSFVVLNPLYSDGMGMEIVKIYKCALLWKDEPMPPFSATMMRNPFIYAYREKSE